MSDFNQKLDELISLAQSKYSPSYAVGYLEGLVGTLYHHSDDYTKERANRILDQTIEAMKNTGF